MCVACVVVVELGAVTVVEALVVVVVETVDVVVELEVVLEVVAGSLVVVVVVSFVPSGASMRAAATPLARSSAAPTPVIAVLSSIERSMVADRAPALRTEPSTRRSP